MRTMLANCFTMYMKRMIPQGTEDLEYPGAIMQGNILLQYIANDNQGVPKDVPICVAAVEVL